MRIIGYKSGVYIHVGRKMATQDSLENQIKTLGKILGHFPSPPLIPKISTVYWRTNNFGLTQWTGLIFET